MVKLDLNNKTAIITGASQGIGKAIAKTFSEAGANLILLSRNEEKLEIYCQELKAKFIIVDVSNEVSIKKAFNQIEKIDIIVNNAGICLIDKAEDTTHADLKTLIDINLIGSINCTRYALPKLQKSTAGRIINISSISGKVGYPFFSAYSASKFGLIGFTQSLAQEVASHNITANCICPGWVETEMAESNLHSPKYAELTGLPLEKLKEFSLEGVPIRRYIHPEEVANLALYLASDLASAITGQSINICGGLCMY